MPLHLSYMFEKSFFEESPNQGFTFLHRSAFQIGKRPTAFIAGPKSATEVLICRARPWAAACGQGGGQFVMGGVGWYLAVFS